MQFTPTYDVERMQMDMVAKGWLPIDLARKAKLSHMTIARFFDGRHRTPRTAKAIAKALGRDLSHYLVDQKLSA